MHKRKISIAELTCGFTEASDNLRNEPEPKVSTIHRFLDSIFQSDKLCGLNFRRKYENFAE